MMIMALSLFRNALAPKMNIIFGANLCKIEVGAENMYFEEMIHGENLLFIMKLLSVLDYGHWACVESNDMGAIMRLNRSGILSVDNPVFDTPEF